MAAHNAATFFATGLKGRFMEDKNYTDHVALEGHYDLPIISVGGIDSAEEAGLRLELGAKLVQLYTGLIYRGPGLVGEIARSL